MKGVFTILLFFLLVFAHAQENRIQELEKQISKSTSESEKLSLTADLAKILIQSDPEKGFPLAEKGLERSITAKNKKQEARFNNVLGIGYMIGGDFEKSLNYFTRSLQLSLLIRDDDHRQKVLGNIGYLYDLSGSYDSAIVMYKQSLDITIRLKDTLNIADNYNSLGISFQNLSLFDSSNTYFNKAIQLHRKINNREGIADAQLNMGINFMLASRLNLALAAFVSSKEIYDSLHVDFKKDLASINIAQVFLKSSRHEDAREHLHELIPDLVHRNELKTLGNAYFLMANSFEETQLFDSARFYYSKALNTHRNSGYREGEGSTLNSMGILLKNEQQYDQAIVLFKDALKIKQELDDPEGIASSLQGLAECYYEKKQTGTALQFAKDAIAIIREYKLEAHNTSLFRLIANLYKDQGDYANAFQHLNIYLDLRDSLESEENRKSLTDLETKYRTKEEQQRNALLQKDNELKNTRIGIVEEQNARKSLLLYATVIVLFLAIGFSIVVIRANRQRKKANELLAQRNEHILAQNQSIREQKEIIEEKQKEITDSINYAKRIQRTLLASDHVLEQHLKSYFILFMPKDIVSGDFYWAHPSKNGFLFMAADCTGHGVPGAFMSMLGVSNLNEIVRENGESRPDIILNLLRERIIHTLNPEGHTEEAKDGMDASLCLYDRENNKLLISCANNPVWIVRNKEVLEIKPDKMPIGAHSNSHIPFQLKEIELEKGDIIYQFTDGYADQFGGDSNKKFKYTRLKELLVEISGNTLSDQKVLLEDTIKAWKGHYEQTDDICISGIKHL